MSNYFIIYFCSIADGLRSLFLTFGIIGMILSVIMYFMCMCAKDPNCDNCCQVCLGRSVAKLNPKYTLGCIVSSFLIFLGTLTPPTSECYKILGIGATIEYISNSNEVKELPENAVKALNEYLKSISKESKDK